MSETTDYDATKGRIYVVLADVLGPLYAPEPDDLEIAAHAVVTRVFGVIPSEVITEAARAAITTEEGSYERAD